MAARCTGVDQPPAPLLHPPLALRAATIAHSREIAAAAPRRTRARRAGESIAGPYVWGRYDLLLLPPSFPYGARRDGMPGAAACCCIPVQLFRPVCSQPHRFCLIAAAVPVAPLSREQCLCEHLPALPLLPNAKG
jgi:hypothetical protein